MEAMTADGPAHGPTAGDHEDLSRALWRRARQQLSEQELALHETQLELNNEKRQCQQIKDATARLLQEASQLLAHKAQLESDALGMYKQLQRVQQDCDVEKADSLALARTLDMAKQRLTAAQDTRDKARSTRAQELDIQAAHNDKLKAHISSLRPAIPDASEGTTAGAPAAGSALTSEA